MPLVKQGSLFWPFAPNLDIILYGSQRGKEALFVCSLWVEKSVLCYLILQLYRDKSRTAHEKAVSIAAAASRERWHREQVVLQHRQNGSGAEAQVSAPMHNRQHCKRKHYWLPALDLDAFVPISSLFLNITSVIAQWAFLLLNSIAVS